MGWYDVPLGQESQVDHPAAKNPTCETIGSRCRTRDSVLPTNIGSKIWHISIGPDYLGNPCMCTCQCHPCVAYWPWVDGRSCAMQLGEYIVREVTTPERQFWLGRFIWIPNSWFMSIPCSQANHRFNHWLANVNESFIVHWTFIGKKGPVITIADQLKFTN